MNNPAAKTTSADSGESSAKKLSESEYLKQQAEAARTAIAGAFEDLKSDLGRGVDPREWMKTHPWMTLASAAVAGFAAAATVIPSKEEQALKKLQAIERAIHKSPDTAGNGHSSGESDHKKEPSGIMALVFRELIGAVKPALIAVLSAKMNPQDPPSTAQADPPGPSGQDA